MNQFKYIFTIFLLTLLSTLVFAVSGTSKIDSLEILVKKEKVDSVKVELLCQLAEEYSKDNKTKCLNLLNEALSIAKKTNNKNIEVHAINCLASFYLGSDLEKSYEFAKEALDLSHKIGNKKEEAAALKTIGSFYFKNKKLDNAIDYYQKSLLIKEKLKDNKGYADLLYNIGYVNHRLSNFTVAVEYYMQARSVYKKINNLKEAIGMEMKIGDIYFFQGDYKTAIEFFNNSKKTAEELKDTMKLGDSYQRLGISYHEWGDYEKAIEYYQKSLNFFEKIKYGDGIANNFINIGLVYQSMNKNKDKSKDPTWERNNNVALDYFGNAQKLMKENKNEDGIRNTQNCMGQIYHDKEIWKTAIAYFDSALTSAREAGNLPDIQELTCRIGYSYFKFEEESKSKKFEKSEKFYNESLSLAKDLGKKTSISELFYRLAQIHIKRNAYEASLADLNKSLEIAITLNAKDHLRDIYKLYSETYAGMGNFKQALEYYKQHTSMNDVLLNELTLRQITDAQTKYQTEKKEKQIKLLDSEKKLQNTQIRQQRLLLWVFVGGFLIIIVFSILLYRQFNEKKKANEILKKQQDEILQKNEELQQQKEEIMAQTELLEETNHELEKLSIVASKTDNAVVIASISGDIEWVNDGFSRLFGYTLEEFIGLKGKNIIEVSSNTNIKQYLNQSINEKKSVVYTSRALTKSSEEIWLQTTLTPIYDSSGNFFKIIAIDSDITKIKQAEQEVEHQRDIALKQRDLISEQKQEITDSINYAQQIQAAVLPTIDFIGSKVSDFFVLFKPRDIVSGDFYWATAKENKLFVAVVDCTGHGVPGAFMSMLGIAFLNEIVNKTFDLRQDNITASEILEQLRDRVITSLHQTGKLGGSQDGMDMVMCILDMDKMIMQYSGANNPIYFIKNKVFKEIKPDKMPIGIHYKTGPFSNHNIEISKGDTLYIFSDGYADQFGGPKAKKFKYKPFQEMLLNLQHHSMPLQKEIIEKNLNEWKGDIPQIDDIVVVGIRV